MNKNQEDCSENKLTPAHVNIYRTHTEFHYVKESRRRNIVFCLHHWSKTLLSKNLSRWQGGPRWNAIGDNTRHGLCTMEY